MIKIVVPHVVDALKDTDGWVRGFAVLTLGRVSKHCELVICQTSESGSRIFLFTSGTCQGDGKCGATHS